jgi:hypothetical protein
MGEEERVSEDSRETKNKESERKRGERGGKSVKDVYE